jgi:hypothetical protein
MTMFRPKLWTTTAAALVMGASLAACGETGEAGEAGEAGATATAPAGEGGEGGAEGGAGAGEAGAQAAYTGVPADSRVGLRLSHLEGFFLIAQKQTDGADAAAALAGQGMLEVFDAQPDAFRSAGVDEAKLRKAAETGAPADLAAAIAAIEAAKAKAGGDALAIAKGQIELAAGLYNGVIADGGVDPIEYQHSLGAALSAKKVLDASSDPKADKAAAEVDKLIALWPAPSAPEKPTPVSQVAAQASRAELALN